MKKIYIGADHGGFKLKEKIKKYLKTKGVEFSDLGTNSEERTDYPIYAKKVSERVQSDKNSAGILICKSGHGMVITANKFKNIRASLAFDSNNIKMGIEDDDINVIAISSLYTDFEEAKKYIDVILNTKFKGTGRYLDRLEMIEELEK